MASLSVLPPIARWTANDARQAIARTLSDEYRVNASLIEDKDLWQGGRLWPGNRTGDRATDGALFENIKSQFVGDDLLSECLDNFADGLLGHEASVILDPLDPADDASPDAVDAQREEADALLRRLSAWWDKRYLWRKVRAAAKRMRYASTRENPNVGRGNLRVWVPPAGLDRIRPAPGRRAGRALPVGLSLDDALARVEVEDVKPDVAAIYVDPETRERVAIIVLDSPGKVEDRVEIWMTETTGEGTRTVGRVLTNAPGVGQGTAARVRDPNAPGPPTVLGETAIDLGGLLPLVECEGDVLVTRPVRGLAGSLNLMTTVLPRTVEFAGHRQRYLTNVEPPGMWLPYPPANGPALEKKKEGAQTFYKHRVNWQLGANITAELIGVRSEDKDGKTIFATPGVTIEDPTDPTFVTKADDYVQAKIYRRMRQGHFANTSTAEASGVAYQQARAQFEADLNNQKGAIEGLVRDTLTVALRYAALMSPEARDLLARYRVVVNLHPHAGPITPDEARVAIEQRAARVISPETAMARSGVEDTVAEVEAIDADPTARADLSVKQAGAAKAWVDAGTSYLAAALLAGLSDADAELFETGLREADRQRAADAAAAAARAAAAVAATGQQPANPGDQPPANPQPPQLAA